MIEHIFCFIREQFPKKTQLYKLIHFTQQEIKRRFLDKVEAISDAELSHIKVKIVDNQTIHEPEDKNQTPR